MSYLWYRELDTNYMVFQFFQGMVYNCQNIKEWIIAVNLTIFLVIVRHDWISNDKKPTRGGSVWRQVQQISFNTSSTTDVLTTCGFSDFGSI